MLGVVRCLRNTLLCIHEYRIHLDKINACMNVCTHSHIDACPGWIIVSTDVKKKKKELTTVQKEKIGMTHTQTHTHTHTHRTAWNNTAHTHTEQHGTTLNGICPLPFCNCVF